MTTFAAIGRAFFLMFGLTMFLNGCVVEPREGYYDRDHHRYYQEHHWHDCGDRDDHCHG